MKVGIDINPLKSGDKVRGVGKYTERLLRALKKLEKEEKGIWIKEIDIEADDLSRLDVIHIPYFRPFTLTVPNIKNKLVVTIHDVIPLIYPKHYPPGTRGWVKLQIQKRRLKNVSAVITDSETSKKDIVRLLNQEAEKVFPIHLASGKGFQKIEKNKKLKAVLKKYKLPKRYILYVGDVNYNKNLVTLIKACEELGEWLVIVGKQAEEIEEFSADIYSVQGPRDWLRFLFNKPHPEKMHYEDLLIYFRNGKKIKRCGYVTQDELVAIYNLATVYCQPSFYEGFGLPVLEAMSCGVPTVVSKTQALVEISANASLFFNTKDNKDMVKKLEKMLDSERIRDKYSKLGIKKANEYSWEETARKTIEVYKGVVGQ